MAESFIPLTTSNLGGSISSITSAVDTNFSTLSTKLNDVLSLVGNTPNKMISNLDMNSNSILNLPFPSTSTSPVRLGDITNNTGVVGAPGPTGPQGPAGIGNFGISVLSYGANGNGSADNYAAFTAALAVAALSPGTDIYVPSGTYILGQQILIPANVGIIGNSDSILKASGSNTTGVLLLEAGNNYIRNITLDGGSGATAFDLVVVFSTGIMTNVVFENCIIQNNFGIGIELSGGSSSGHGLQNSGVRNCRFFNIGNYTGVTTGSRSQCIAFSNGTLSSNLSNFAINNYFDQMGLDCISIGNQTNFLCSGNRMKNQAQLGGATSGGGVYVTGCVNVTVSNNIINTMGGNAIDTISSTGLVIIGNIISNSGACGIGTFGNTNVVIANNYSINNWQSALYTFSAGITATGPGSNILITDNICADTQGSPTQQYGVQYITSGGSITNLVVTLSNVTSGNVVAGIQNTISQPAY